MEKIVLITDVDTPLGHILAKLYSNSEEKVIGTISRENPENSITDIDRELVDVIEWRRNSPIETKNLILTILNKYKRLDEALIIQSVNDSASLLHETAITEIDRAIDYWIKGLFFLTREIVKTYQNRKHGSLYFIRHLGAHVNTSSILEGVTGSMNGFIGHILRTCQNNPFTINSIESSYTKAEDFGPFVYKQITERLRQCTGKRVQFQHKLGLFAGIKKSR